MKQTKYIMSGGLAFAEDKDMEKLRGYSSKGWHVKDYKFMGYTLEKGECSDYIYSIDNRSIGESEAEEYFEMFTSSGWSHIASETNIHLFRAYPGTQPIYSDRETLVEKYSNLISTMQYFTMSLVFITVLAWIGAMLSSGTLASTLLLIAVILSIITVPTAWTLMTTYRNKWEVEGRNGRVNLVKIMPYLVLLSLMIALPTVIFCISSYYHRVKGKLN